MKIFFLSVVFTAAFILARAQDPKVVGDCTITFSISSNESSTNDNLSGAVKTLYIKGDLTRTDINSTDYRQSTFYDSKTGEAVILKELQNNKYMQRLTPEKWKQQNSRFDGMNVSFTAETKTILGYPCKKGIAQLKDGTSFIFFYAPGMMPSALENPYEFKGIPGFVLEYEISGKSNKTEIAYTATKINFSPVPESKFQIPSSGYRDINN